MGVPVELGGRGQVGVVFGKETRGEDAGEDLDAEEGANGTAEDMEVRREED